MVKFGIFHHELKVVIIKLKILLYTISSIHLLIVFDRLYNLVHYMLAAVISSLGCNKMAQVLLKETF